MAENQTYDHSWSQLSLARQMRGEIDIKRLTTTVDTAQLVLVLEALIEGLTENSVLKNPNGHKHGTMAAAQIATSVKHANMMAKVMARQSEQADGPPIFERIED